MVSARLDRHSIKVHHYWRNEEWEGAIRGLFKCSSHQIGAGESQRAPSGYFSCSDGLQIAGRPDTRWPVTMRVGLVHNTRWLHGFQAKPRPKICRKRKDNGTWSDVQQDMQRQSRKSHAFLRSSCVMRDEARLSKFTILGSAPKLRRVLTRSFLLP